MIQSPSIRQEQSSVNINTDNNHMLRHQSSTDSSNSESKISRRSIDWRDSGIFIDTDSSECSSKRSSLDVIEDNFDNTTDNHLLSLSSSNFSVSSCVGYNLNSRDSIFSSTDSSSCIFLSTENIDDTHSNDITQQILLDRVRIQDEDGDTVLHLAVLGCSFPVLQDLVKVYNKADTLDIMNNMMHTPLHLATMIHRDDAVQLLIQAGASPTMIDRKGNTCLHVACQNGHQSTVATILNTLSSITALNTDDSAKDARISWTTTNSLIEMNNFDGVTCLHLAALGGHLACIETLVKQYKADLTSKEGKLGQTCLHIAIKTVNLELVTFILEHCEHHLCTIANFSGHRPLKIVRRMLMMECDDDKILKLTRIEQLIQRSLELCTNDYSESSSSGSETNSDSDSD